MKPIGESFGFGTLITVFLPGLTLALGVVLVYQSDPDWQLNLAAILKLFDGLHEWQQTFAAIAIISLLGSLVAALNGFMESMIYDRVTTARMGLSRQVFLDHWCEYLYRLSKENNSYITRIATWFLFESRMAVAVATILIFYVVEAPDRQLHVVVLLLFAILILGALGAHHHRELGEYRACWYDQWRVMREAERAAVVPATGTTATP